MKRRSLLLPHSLKKYGWMLSIPSFCIGAYYVFTGSDFTWLTANVPAVLADGSEGFLGGNCAFFTMTKNDLTDELIASALLVGLYLLSFTREKVEDEYISRIRAESMLWAVFVQMMVFLVALWTIYGMPFWTFMLINLYLLPLVFVVRYYGKLYVLNRQV